MFNELSDFQYLLLLSANDITINSLLKEALFFFTRSDATIMLAPP